MTATGLIHNRRFIPKKSTSDFLNALSFSPLLPIICSVKKTSQKKTGKRGTKVFIGLTAALTLTAGILLAMSPAPLKPDSAAMLAPQTLIDTSAPTAAHAPAWQYIYLHHSRSNAPAGQGDHFLVHPDGRVETTVRWQRQLAPLPPVSTARMPGNAVSIQLVGDFDQLPPTPQQLTAAEQLTNNLRTQYQIPTSNILLTQVPRSAASHGAKFPTEAFKSALAD